MEKTPLVPPPGGTYNWARACSLGCGVMLLAGLVAGVVVYRISVENIRAKREVLVTEVAAHYDRLKSTGKIPADHAAFYEETMAESRREAVGFFGLLLYGGGILSPLEDGVLTTEELALVQETRAYLKANPAPSPMDYGDYVSARPLLQDEISAFEAAASAKH